MFDFKLAVIGPTVTRWLAIAHSCADCAASRPDSVTKCQGFGPGCIQRQAPEPRGDRKPFIPA